MDIESQEIRKTVPLIGLTIGAASLLFSITVLYPWHLELSRELKSLITLVRDRCEVL
jgi:hypothetical protein